MRRLYISTKELADFLGVHAETLRRDVRAGRYDKAKIGSGDRPYRFRIDAIEKQLRVPPGTVLTEINQAAAPKRVDELECGMQVGEQRLEELVSKIADVVTARILAEVIPRIDDRYQGSRRDGLLTFRQAADYLGIPRRVMQRLVDRGDIKPVDWLEDWRVRKSTLDAFGRRTGHANG